MANGKKTESSTKGTKRSVPQPLQKLLSLDQILTKRFCDVAESFLPYTKNRKHYKLLEHSCHALLWFFIFSASMWLLWSEELFQTQINLLFAMTVDCLVVACLKAAVRRRRPPANQDDMILTLQVDAYSFPSGHVTRAVMLTYFALFTVKAHSLVSAVAIVWSTAVLISRVLLKRHYILDVVGGLVVGTAEAWLISLLWLSRATSVWLVHFLSDEAVNLEGLQDDFTPSE